MTEKRYQVFVSSTFVDLQDERSKVIQSLLELNCMPAGMELFPAADEDQWTLIKEVIDNCDYYVVIIGGRYGSTAPDGLGYTEKEYRYAVEMGKPVVAFLHSNPGQIIASKTEKDDKGKKLLEEFRQLVQKKMIKHWSSPDELRAAVTTSMVVLMRKHPAVGWVKATGLADAEAKEEILNLQKQVDVLRKQLDQARITAPPGSELYAQTTDEHQINFDAKIGERSYNAKSISLTATATWNEIFSAVAPFMIDEVSDHRLKSVLDQWIGLREKVSLTKAAHGHPDWVQKTEIAIDDFQTIKVQLRSLGLITQSSKTRSVKDVGTYWSLTPYGDQKMTELRAIKKQQSGES